MTAIVLEMLPLGYRFHPTDEELVNHYLKRKINGRIKSEAEVIPEVDVCKCEPWDLPDKSIIRSDDLEWFFFAPKNRKYANGRRSNRATEAGYWKATGADRSIRSKAAAARDKIIGMKKTLVFHLGRAPNGIRTGWIMHEYRTTEPEFESGVQGGYVLYKLFHNTEEKSPNRKSKADEMERGDFSPTPTKSSPDDTQQEADVMEATMLNQESPESVHQSPPDLVEEQLTDSVKPDESSCSIASENHDIKAGVHVDPPLDVSTQFHDSLNEQVDSSGFPNISSLMLPNTDDPISGINQGPYLGYADDGDPDFWNELVNELVGNQDEHSSGTSNVQKDSVAETVPRNSIRDSALDSAASSDLDIEAVLPQELLGLGVSNLEESPFMFNDPLQMNVDEFLAIEQWSPPFENASFLPYDNTGPDVYSLDSTAESLQDLCSGMEETSNQKNVANNGDGLEVTGIIMRTRQPQHPSNSNVFAQQGTATRRIRLQNALLLSDDAAAAAPCESICSKDDHEDKEARRKALQDLFDSTEESLSQKNTPVNGDVLEGTGIEIRSRQARYPPSLNKISSKQGTAARRIRLQSHIKMKSFSSPGGESSSSKDDHEDKESMTESLQAGEHADANIAEVRELPKPAFPDKLEQSSVHDNAAHSSELYQEPKPMLRLRARCADDDATIPEGPPSRPRFPRTASLGYVIWLVLSVILLLMCVGIWRCKYSHSM